MTAAGDSVDRWLQLWRESDPESRRVIAFVVVAIKQGVWPGDAFLATPPSETAGESVALFHRTIRSIPEAQRKAVWLEVDALELSGRPTINA